MSQRKKGNRSVRWDGDDPRFDAEDIEVLPGCSGQYRHGRPPQEERPFFPEREMPEESASDGEFVII